MTMYRTDAEPARMAIAAPQSPQRLVAVDDHAKNLAWQQTRRFIKDPQAKRQIGNHL